MSKKLKIVLAVVLLLAVAAAAVLLYQHFSPKASEGAKTVAVQIVHGDGTKKELTLHTDAETLRGALEEQSLIEGSESEYGLYVTTVDGEAADDTQQQWWCFNDGKGEMLPTGVDSTMIQDGDVYEIVLKTGW
ncbi:MAG: DUF4430 domain-containing protein [Oscillospiraceae bacterium]|nr:DUF4430 domain-containing protein [Oscillospiraceae bacterium]